MSEKWSPKMTYVVLPRWVKVLAVVLACGLLGVASIWVVTHVVRREMFGGVDFFDAMSEGWKQEDQPWEE